MIEKIKEYIIDNNLEKSIELLLKYDEIYKENIEFINLKAITYLKCKEWEYSITNFNYALKLIENSKENLLDIELLKIDILFNLAYAYEMNENIKEAIDVYNKIIKQSNKNDDIEESKVNIKKINIIIEAEKEKKYKKEDLINNENYAKTIIRDLSYKSKPEEGKDIFENRRNLNKLREDENPLVSIYILAYNNLEKYTKPCVESVLKYTTNIDYELILVDNGSTDGTYEYFKSINHEKKKIISITKNVGIGYQSLDAFNVVKGKYIVMVWNDTIVTEKWLDNMIKCAESDPKIGMICPASDNISNLQSLDLNYKTIEEMQHVAKKNNISDPRRWNERLKLVTVVTLYTRECIDMIGITDYGFLHDYADDDITFRVRRAGYKAVLCKDSFCSHRGMISDKGIEFAKKTLEIGKKFFYEKYYGVYAEDAMNYELNLISLLNYKDSINEKISVLGIDTKCGTPILEIKNKFREHGLFDVELTAFSEKAKYWLDLNTICNKVDVDRVDFLNEYYDKKFDYILLGKELNLYKDPYKLIDNILNKIKDSGEILLKLKNTHNLSTLLKILENRDNENIHTFNMDIDYLNQYLNKKGFKISKIVCETNDYETKIDEYLRNINIKQEKNENYNQLKLQLSTINYLIKVVRINNKI